MKHLPRFECNVYGLSRRSMNARICARASDTRVCVCGKARRRTRGIGSLPRLRSLYIGKQFERSHLWAGTCELG